MQISFTYDKKKVMQGLRYHFISRPEIRIMIILVNIFAILSAILFYLHKISPQPFLIGSCLWLFLMLSFWFILPYSIYKRSQTFRDKFSMYFNDSGIRLENGTGYVSWSWERFSYYKESPHFFHLYFSPKSFFLIPKDNLDSDQRHEIREIFGKRITCK